MDHVVAVVTLSDAFADLWVDLAAGIASSVRLVEPGDPVASGPELAAVVLAAGGAERDAIEWLERERPPREIPVIAVGSDVGHRAGARLVAAGATDYVALPGDVDLLRNLLAGAADGARRAARRSGETALPADAFASLIGNSETLKRCVTRARRVLPHGAATVLLTGESGTGKELLARAIHDGGPRSGAPFVEVNCTALPAQLLESELFGHERGAFTDARTAKPGLFEVADGGTLFLDEIGHLAIELQAKLLRVLEDKKVRRVGATASRQVDVRIIAATNEDLIQAGRAGTFRDDLFFRLSVISIALPPLRERGDDAVLIAGSLLDRLARQYDVPPPEIDEEIQRAILGYHWPGNVRELRNAVERALLLSDPGRLAIEEMVPATREAGAVGQGLPFPASLAAISEAAAQAMVEHCDGNRSEAARRLEISRTRLARLLESNR